MLQVNLTVSSSVCSSRTSYWPLCSGGRLSQEAMWQLQGITVNLKKKEKKGFKPEECTSRNDFSTIPHQTLSKGEPHYIPHTAEKPSRLDASTRDGNSDWTKTRCWWFLGTNRTGMGLLSLHMYLLVELVFMLASVCFFLLYFGGGGVGGSLRRTIYLHLFQGREQE